MGAAWGTDPDIHTIHISESRPETIYTATANGPYRSDDGGDSWRLVNSGLANRYSVPVSAAPEDHRRVMVSVSDNAGRRSGARAYLSTDAGESWSQLDIGADDDMVIAYEWDPHDRNRVYAGTDSGKPLRKRRQWRKLGTDRRGVGLDSGGGTGHGSR